MYGLIPFPVTCLSPNHQINGLISASTSKSPVEISAVEILVRRLAMLFHAACPGDMWRLSLEFCQSVSCNVEVNEIWTHDKICMVQRSM